MTSVAITLDATPQAVARRSCPLCERPARAVFLTRAEIAEELRARDRFFATRLDRRFSRDLTDVVLGTPEAIRRCTRCGVLVRDAVPGDEVFRDDRYDDRVLELLHGTHVQAFTARESDYRPLLPAGARVAEVGSYVGGFLTAAGQWGWSATGVDIGRDVVRFCRRLGLDVRDSLDMRSLDAVFIWNCFEQIADPYALLEETHRALHPAGLLVIRVPDADFYARRLPLEILGYNSLLGWPHRFGYGAETLRRLVEQHAFEFVHTLRRPAIRPFREAMHSWAREEEARLIGEANYGWIEMIFRRG